MKAFKYFDLNNNGTVEPEEFAKAIEKIGIMIPTKQVALTFNLSPLSVHPKTRLLFTSGSLVHRIFRGKDLIISLGSRRPLLNLRHRQHWRFRLQRVFDINLRKTCRQRFIRQQVNPRGAPREATCQVSIKRCSRHYRPRKAIQNYGRQPQYVTG